MRRRPLLIVAVLGSLFAVIVFVVPGATERALNQVVPHPSYFVSEAARALHATIDVSDLHADPLLWKRDWLERAGRGHTDLPRMLEGGVALQVMTAPTKTPLGQNYERNVDGFDVWMIASIAQLWPSSTWFSVFGRAVHQLRTLEELAFRSDGRLRIVRSRSDLRQLLDERVLGAKPIGAIFGIEGAHALEGDLARLDELDRMGMRVVGLTHFFDNELGGSLHGVSGEGLSEFGRSVILEAARRRLVVDVAHASSRMVADVLALSDRPVILSHGGFKGNCDTARNLDDTVMQQIAAHGGLIGVGFWDGAVCDPTPAGVVRAIRYGIELVGVDHIALGSDFDGGTTVHFDAAELPVLTQAMLDADFSEAEIRQVMGDNATRFFLAQLP